MRERFARRARWFVLCAALGLLVANAGTDLEVLNVDLAPLIERAAPRTAQFAVDVPYAASLDTRGTWTRGDDTSTWTHSVRVPGAVSLSFHATTLVLPTGAVLRVSGGGETYVYDRAGVRRRELWSRVARGDTLSFELVVPSALESDAALRIASLQAGYRALAIGQRNHPSYDAIIGRGRVSAAGTTAGESPPTALASAGGAACAENYECRTTPATQVSAAATLVVTVRNVYQCTGTLVADVPGTRRPYVLTARHCQLDDAGNDDPGAAAATFVYWNAVSACGVPLPTYFNASNVTQAGGTTRVLQQDAWLFELADAPAWPDAYWSGWDATGGTFVGGYSVHHAVGFALQYAQWFGQPVFATRQAARYAGQVWRVTNEIGNIGAGASGSALFDPQDRLVGVLSRGTFAPGDTSGYGVCPAAPPTVPTTDRWAGEFVALSGIWNSTADASSPTGATTVKSLLDPQGTGTLVASAVESRPRVQLTSTNSFPQNTGQNVTLTWSSVRADACVASGGAPGSSWPGANLPASGSRTFTESAVGTYDYTITCSRGGASTSATRSIPWALPPVSVTVRASDPGPFVTEPVTIEWSSNVAPCEATGGEAGDGWAGSRATSGTLTVRQTVASLARYQLRCGVPGSGREGSAEAFVNPLEPAVRIAAGDLPPSLRIGMPLLLDWGGSARACTTSGGRAGDGWSGRTGTAGGTTLTSSVPGAVTYRVECTAGTRTVSDEVTANWTGDPASARLTVVSPQPIRLFDAAAPSLFWTANVRPCALSFTGPASGAVPLFPGTATGSAVDFRDRPGRYTYTLTCGSGADTASSTADIDWVWPTPVITLRVVNSPAFVDDPVSLNWQSNVLPCTASGGAPADGWPGDRAASGLYGARVTTPGRYTWTLTCGEGAQTGSTTVAVDVVRPPAPTLDLRFDVAAVAPGTGAVLRWTTTDARSCTATGGTAASGWVGPRPPSGSAFIVEPVAGTYTYTLACANSAGVVERSASLAVTQANAPTATLTASASTVTVGQAFTLSWSSVNASSCLAAGGAPGDGWAGTRAASGEASVVLNAPGAYSYSIQCGGSRLVQQSIAVVPREAPQITLTATPESVVVGQPFTLTWSATQTAGCYAYGGVAGDGWLGNRELQGSYAITPDAVGERVYGLDCSSSLYAVRAERHVVVAAPAPTATLTSNVATGTVGEAFTLTWSSTNATACGAVGGANGDGWAGSALATSGSRSVTVAAAGSYSYAVDCNGAGGTVRAEAQLTVNARPAAGGGGGGGDFGWAALALLGLVPLLRLARDRAVSLQRSGRGFV